MSKERFSSNHRSEKNKNKQDDQSTNKNNFMFVLILVFILILIFIIGLISLIRYLTKYSSISSFGYNF